MSTRQLKAVIRSRVTLHEGFLRLYRYVCDVEKHAGGTLQISREVMERGNAVAVLGHDPVRDEIVLVNELRAGALAAGDYPYRDNLVAGAIDSGETALEAAVREMQEEAGLVLSSPMLIHPGLYVSSGGTSEKIALVYGTVDTRAAGGVHGNPEEQEDILTVVLKADVLIERVRGGQIDDMKTLVAGYWFAEHHDAGTLPVTPGNALPHSR